jgi:hypothetical protein
MWKIYFLFVFLINAILRELSLCWVPWHEGLLGVWNTTLLLISSQHHTGASEKYHWFSLSFSSIREEVVSDKYFIVCSKNHTVVIQSTVFHFTLWANVAHIVWKQQY